MATSQYLLLMDFEMQRPCYCTSYIMQEVFSHFGNGVKLQLILVYLDFKLPMYSLITLLHVVTIVIQSWQSRTHCCRIGILVLNWAQLIYLTLDPNEICVNFNFSYWTQRNLNKTNCAWITSTTFISMCG